MFVIQSLTRVGGLAANLVRNIFREFARGGAQYAVRQTEIYTMRRTEKGYEYEQRQEAGC